MGTVFFQQDGDEMIYIGFGFVLDGGGEGLRRQSFVLGWMF